VLNKYVEHAVGSVTNPMSDKDLEAKFLGQSDGVLPAEQARRVMELCWGVESLGSAASIAEAASV
jgi:2-methylcitrate dehydratase PrpD